MKKFFRYITIFCILCAINLQTVAMAGVLGTPSGGWQTDMGGGAIYSNNVFTDNSVRQTENYVEYTKNSDARPIVVNGESIYGSRTISSAAEYMRKNNLRPLIGINGDYFSTKTGIPMGYTIIDNRIVSKESGVQDAIGFREDGSSFIDKIAIKTTLASQSDAIDILYINKWPQKGFSWVYLLDSNYSTETKTNFNALYVICSAKQGELSVNSEIELVVDEVFIYDGSIKIPDGKYVFVMDTEGEKKYFDFLSRLAAGDTLKLKNEVFGATRHNWEEARYALSSIGGRLIDNGQIQTGFEKGIAPRTAVGIKENGNVIFYTVDGRMAGYSTGVSLNALAKRLAELGCVDAINLDGGGSTAIGGVFPGFDNFIITNKPSDGRERRCANYIFLQDLRKPTGIVWFVDWNERDNHNYLSGTQYKLEARNVYDTGNYKMDGLEGVTMSLENGEGSLSTMTDDGLISFSGAGKVYVTVKGEAYNKTFSFETFDKPEEIKIINQATGEFVDKLVVDEGGMINYRLEAGAYVNGIRLESSPSQFSWSVDGKLAEVNSDGAVSIKDDGSKEGILRVSANGVETKIPIVVIDKPAFSDTQGHWADEIINEMADKGIINGFYENGEMIFKPDSNITRIQFSAIIAKVLSLNPDDYKDVTLPFSDADKIQPWATNYVKAMVKLGYMNGSTDGSGGVYFAPDNNITRAEAFTVMGRIIDENIVGNISYSDNSQIPSWAYESFSKLFALNIINGFEDNTIRPQNTLTRAEAVALVRKFTDNR